MAKNLKLNIKNAQLAEALKLKKKKKPEAEEKPAKKEATADTPAKVKVKKRPTIGQPPAPEPEKKEVAPTPTPVPEKTSSEVAPKAPEKPKPPVAATPKAKPAPTTPEKKPVKKDLKPPNKRPPAKEYRDLKQRRPDSREKHGLRGQDEGRWRRRRSGGRMKTQRSPEEIVRPKNLSIKLPITLKDLAAAMKLKAAELIAKLFMQGVVITINDFLDDETTIQLLGHEFGCDIQIDRSEQKRLQITDKTIDEEIKATKEEQLSARPPIIAFMGHVDHGKTSLIDYIRKSNITSKEAGAITQHIGAFQCHLEKGEITILDTPGHEAFTSMRERGATVTDIVILVVAGDEGIKPQTVEALNQAREASVPIIVAVNKCDRPNFNADDVYRQLSEHELLPESWGGSTITVNTSATTGEGISDLLEMILLQSDILEIKANKQARARGTVLESELHKGLGSAATLLVLNGTLKPGDALVIDEIYGRVKTMHDEHGKNVAAASPATPVKITGLSGVPEAGTEFIVVKDEKEARKLTEERAAGKVRERLRRPRTRALEDLLIREQELQEKKVLNIILRADVQGSLEALKTSLLKIKSEKAELNFVSEGVGEISESDIELAHASDAVVVGFHTKVESHSEEAIKKHKVVVKTHDIIYHLIDDVKEQMRALLDKIREEHEMGEARVQAVFKSSQLGLIAGCIVTEGVVKRAHIARLYREGEEIWSGEMTSLKRVKEDVREVKKGIECGILLDRFSDFKVDDIIKTFEVSYKEQDL